MWFPKTIETTRTYTWFAHLLFVNIGIPKPYTINQSICFMVGLHIEEGQYSTFLICDTFLILYKAYVIENLKDWFNGQT